MTIRVSDRVARLAPAGLAAVTATALWTALALVVPVVATGNAAALVVILAAGIVVVRLRLALLAAAGSALLIFLVISLLLPAVPGFVGNDHPPIYTPVTRLVDPIAELAVFVLLAVALGGAALRTRIRTHRAALRHRQSRRPPGPNEMVVERDV